MIIRAIIEFDAQTQSFSATCPELINVSSCGMTKEEAVKNLQEAIALMLEPIPEKFLNKNTTTENYELMELVI
jgi:predicted RNase H-like HicB family nuclease